MSTAAPMQQAKTDAAKPVQHISQLAAQTQQIGTSETQSEFADLRSQTTAQRQRQDAANHSPQSRQLKAFQQMAQNSARAVSARAMGAMMNTPAVQRMVDEKDLLQAKDANENTAQLETAAEASKPNNTGLPNNLKSGIESVSGMSMDHVKVHYNSSQPAQLNAHAYAQGSDIHVAAGQEQHLPHEAWHVVQQAQGRVQPTVQMKMGVPVNDDVGLETEADVMGAKALGIGQLMTQTQATNLSNRSTNANKSSYQSHTPVQRIVETVTATKNYDALKVLTLRSLISFANEQVDWHSAVADLTERTRIRNILHTLRKQEAILSAGSDWVVKDFWDKVKDNDTDLKPAAVATLDAYGRGVAEETARLNSGATLDDALLYGAAIQKLEAKIGAVTLAYIFLPSSFKDLYDNNYVDDFVSYVDNVKPTLTANDGEEVDAYNAIRQDEGKNPEDYKGTVLNGFVRNFHRFKKDALDTLVTNYAYTTKDKDLTMILHTTVDDNGAFYRDDELTGLIENATFVLMLEGFATLDAMKSKVSEIAGTHGKGGKIRDVMLAGHGNSRSIGMAGTVKEQGGMVKIKEDDLELDTNEDATDEFIDSILGDLENNAGDHARIVLNACLTNSNAVDLDEGEFTDVVLEDAKRIRDYIEDNPSLALRISQRAALLGIHVTALGSNSSTTNGVEFEDAGRLVMQGGDDPLLTSPKAEYVKAGIEPEGALRAVLEEWANNARRATTLTNVETRKNLGDDTDWSEQLIRSMYALIHNHYRDTGSAIMSLANAASDLSEIPSESEVDTEGVSGVLEGRKDDAIFIFSKMTTTDAWKNKKHVPLVCLQVWAEHDAGKSINFAQHLAAKFTLKSATKYDFIPDSYPFASTIPEGDGAHPAPGQLLLALVGFISHKDEDSKKFLLKHLEGEETFPVGDNIAALLDGKTSENKILINLGKMEAAAPGEKKANLKLDGDGSNKEWVKPLTKRGKITEDGVTVKSKKGNTGSDLGVLDTDAPVFILGEIDTEYAIESGVKTGFIPKIKIKDLT